MVTTNALPTMAPWGGAERLLGINPLGVGIPAGDEWPIVYDAAFSASAHGKLRVYKQRGQSIPSTWALDADGRPTTDPAAAIDGLLQPIGEFKGANLAMIMGVLSSMLSGASYGTQLGDMYSGARAGQDGHFVCAMRVEAFEDTSRFKTRVDESIRQVHGSRLAPGFERVYAPGEKEFLTHAAYSREGIPLTLETIADVLATARALGLEAAHALD
jgi:LDH2 family malate/lactate/ureidoglycolate dehydrogenase